MASLMTRTRDVVAAHRWISAGIALVLVGGAVTGYELTGDSTAQAQNGELSRLVAASVGSVRQTVSATGTFKPADEDDVSFSSSAEVTSVRVAVGDRVAKGQILGTIDDLALRAALAEARASLASAQAALTSAQDSGTATSDQLSADEAAVSSARSSLAAARTALEGATLRSPIAGTVAQVNVAKGDHTAGSSPQNGASDSSSSSSSADFVVVGLHAWTVSASLDDTEVGLVHKGDQVQITTDDVAGLVFGVVSSVGVLSSSTSGSATYPVQIEVTGSPSGLHDGASGTVSIIYHQLSNVLTVPTAAVHASSSGSYVYVASGGKKVRRTITTGLSGGGVTQVKSGLTSGEQVYLDISVGIGRSSTSTNGQNSRRFFLPGSGGVVPGAGFVPGGGGGKFPVTSGGGGN